MLRNSDFASQFLHLAHVVEKHSRNLLHDILTFSCDYFCKKVERLALHWCQEMQTEIFELNSSTSPNCYRVTVSCADDGKWRTGEIVVRSGELTKLLAESISGIFISAEAAIAHAIAWAILHVWKLESPSKSTSAEKK